MKRREFTLRGINTTLTTTLTFLIDEASVRSSRALRTAKRLSLEGWDINIVNQDRGRCYPSVKVISIPAWAYNRGPDYFDYYLSHELAHAVTPIGANHGPEFMAAFKSICKPENWHYELKYKPANAAKAGIMHIPDDF